jgi:hypothetical protein
VKVPDGPPFRDHRYELEMVLAVVFRVRRPGERPNIVLNVIFGVIAAVIVYGRSVIAPF